MLRRLLILMPGMLAASGALLQMGCGDDVSESGLPGDMFSPTEAGDAATADMALVPGADGGVVDPQDDGYPANPDTELGLDGASDSRSRNACYAAASTLECSDALCATLPVCCVGATRDGCCAATDRVPPTDIGDGDCSALDCLGPGARAFGLPAPSLSDGLVTGGDGSGDGGVVYEPAIDLRNRTIALEGTIVPPTASCEDGCLETIALALLREAPPSGETVLVQPMAALRYSGANGRMILEAGGEILHRFTEDPAGRWRFEASPDGALRVLREGSELLALPNRFVPGWVHPAVFGRTRNPSASGGEAARLTRLSVQVDTCDIPTGWAPGAPIAFTEPPSPSLGRPSLWVGEPTLLAVDDAGTLRFFRQSVSGRFDPLELPMPATEVVEPELVTGNRVIALGADQAVVASDLDPSGAAPLSWSTLLPSCGDCERRSPTASTAFDGTPVLMVLENGRPRVFAGEGGEGFYQVAPALSAIVDALTTPAADERRTGLSLVLRDEAWHLHVTYARGTRSLVRLFVSEELVVWRGLGTVFGPSGEGFDALQVWSFSVARSRDEGVLRAVYRGSDGVDPALGTTTRPAP